MYKEKALLSSAFFAARPSTEMLLGKPGTSGQKIEIYK